MGGGGGGGWVPRKAMDIFFKNFKGTTFDFWREMWKYGSISRNLEIFPKTKGSTLCFLEIFPFFF